MASLALLAIDPWHDVNRCWVGKQSRTTNGKLLRDAPL